MSLAARALVHSPAALGRVSRRAANPSAPRHAHRDLPRSDVIRFPFSVSGVRTRAKKSDGDEDTSADGSGDRDSGDSEDQTGQGADTQKPSNGTNPSDESVNKKNESFKKKEKAAAKKKKDAADVAAAALASKEDVAPALEGDWRDFRARLVSMESTSGDSDSKTDGDETSKKVASASGSNLALLKKQKHTLSGETPWAHVIGAPERGCLLIARGESFTGGQQYFHQAVILVLEHNEKGSMGVILNRPTQYTMGYVSGDDASPFSQNALYFGGDVGDGTVSFLHGSAVVSGSVEVTPGVFLGGYDSACDLVNQGDVKPNECKFFARYCGWGAGQVRPEGGSQIRHTYVLPLTCL